MCVLWVKYEQLVSIQRVQTSARANQQFSVLGFPVVLWLSLLQCMRDLRCNMLENTKVSEKFLDHPQNPIQCFLSQGLTFPKISCNFMLDILNNSAHRPTNQPTNKQRQKHNLLGGIIKYKIAHNAIFKASSAAKRTLSVRQRHVIIIIIIIIWWM